MLLVSVQTCGFPVVASKVVRRCVYRQSAAGIEGSYEKYSRIFTSERGIRYHLQCVMTRTRSLLVLNLGPDKSK